MATYLFKLDENLPSQAAAPLSAAGHDVATVLEQNLAGATDSQIADVCRREQRALVTLDTDFADIRAYRPGDFAGLLVLRLARQDVAHVISVLTRLAPVLENESIAGRLWIVEETRVRMRE